MITSQKKDKTFYKSFNNSCKQAKLQMCGELPEKPLDDLINELNDIMTPSNKRQYKKAIKALEDGNIVNSQEARKILGL